MIKNYEEVKRMKLNEKLLVTSLVLVFLSGTLYTTSDWSFLQPVLFIGGTALIVVSAITTKLKGIRFDLGLIVSFMLFAFFSLLSSYLLEDFKLLIESLVWIYIYITLSIIFPSIIKDCNTGLKLISTALLLGVLPLLTVPLFIADISTKAYSSIFYNPNSLGNVAVTVAAVSLALLTFYFERYIKGEKIGGMKLFTILLLNLLLLLLVIFSSSRTSFITFLVMNIISWVLLINKVIFRPVIKVKHVKKLITLFISFVIVGVVAYLFTPLSDVLTESISSKFERKSENLTDGRSDVWISVISDASWFGHGEHYFTNLKISAHNTFISILGQYGIIPLLFLAIFLIQLLIKSFNLVKKVNSAYKYLPILTVILFITLSMGESMLYKPAMLLIFSLNGFLNSNLKDYVGN